MKKSLLVLLALGALQAFADSPESLRPSIWMRPENQSASDVYITPIVGVAAMGVHTSGKDLDSDSGLSVGALAEFGKGALTFQTGALYNEFGGKAGEVKLNLDYLSIPLMAKFNFMGNSTQTVYIKGGVMPGVLMSSTWSNGFGSTSATGVNTFDLPIVVGVGGAMPVAGNASLVVEASYVRSLLNISSSKDDGSAYNNGFLVGAGVNIAL